MSMVKKNYSMSIEVDVSKIEAAVKRVEQTKLTPSSPKKPKTPKDTTSQTPVAGLTSVTDKDKKKDKLSEKQADDTAGILGTLKTFAGPLAAVTGISLTLGHMWGEMTKSSGILSGVLGIFGHSMRLFFKPFGDALGTFLLPMAIHLMRYAVQFNRSWGPALLDIANWAAGVLGIGPQDPLNDDTKSKIGEVLDYLKTLAGPIGVISNGFGILSTGVKDGNTLLGSIGDRLSQLIHELTRSPLAHGDVQEEQGPPEAPESPLPDAGELEGGLPSWDEFVDSVWDTLFGWTEDLELPSWDEFVDSVWDTLFGWTGTSAGDVIDAFSSSIDFLGETLGKPLFDGFQLAVGVFGEISAGFGEIIAGFGGFASMVGDAVSGFGGFTTVFNNIVAGLLAGIAPLAGLFGIDIPTVKEPEPKPKDDEKSLNELLQEEDDKFNKDDKDETDTDTTDEWIHGLDQATVKIEDAIDDVGDVFEDIGETVHGDLETVEEFIGDLGENVHEDLEAIGEGVGEVFENVGENVHEDLEAIGEGVGEVFEDVGAEVHGDLESLEDTFENVGEEVHGDLTANWNAINDLGELVVDTIDDITGVNLNESLGVGHSGTGGDNKTSFSGQGSGSDIDIDHDSDYFGSSGTGHRPQGTVRPYVGSDSPPPKPELEYIDTIAEGQLLEATQDELSHIINMLDNALHGPVEDLLSKSQDLRSEYDAGEVWTESKPMYATGGSSSHGTPNTTFGSWTTPRLIGLGDSELWEESRDLRNQAHDQGFYNEFDMTEFLGSFGKGFWEGGGSAGLDELLEALNNIEEWRGHDLTEIKDALVEAFAELPALREAEDALATEGDELSITDIDQSLEDVSQNTMEITDISTGVDEANDNLTSISDTMSQNQPAINQNLVDMVGVMNTQNTATEETNRLLGDVAAAVGRVESAVSGLNLSVDLSGVIEYNRGV